MQFKKWLLEFGGNRGFGLGLTPPMERPEAHATALPDHHDGSGSDPGNPNGMLPPVKKGLQGLYKINGNKRSSKAGRRRVQDG